MNIWANTVLTDKGRALLAKLTQGNTLNITRAVTGAGFVTPGFLAKQTEVTDPKQTLEIRSASYPETGTCALTVALRNEVLTVGYEATQVGIYAMDPDEGEILFFISQATAAGSGTIIPSETEMASYSAEWTFYFQYGQADSVNVTVDPAGAVSREEMEGLAGQLADALKWYIDSGLKKKVDAEEGKGLSTNDYTTEEKKKLAGAVSREEAEELAGAKADNLVKYVDAGLGKKVDKVDGKGLSTNDYTTAEKQKLAGISSYMRLVEGGLTKMPAKKDWMSVAYGDGKFVAVAGSLSQEAAYSTDGVNWIQTTMPSGLYWSSVTYGNGVFIAVAEHTTAAYSTDGISWSEAQIYTRSLSWTSVAYGDGKFVAVADGNSTARYSTDGITWYPATLPFVASWHSVAYGDGKFVAVATYTADGGTYSTVVAYSTDGITWYPSTLEGSADWKTITYGGGKFVAVENGGDFAAYSTDGITWTLSTLPISAAWTSVAYGDGKFVAVAGNGTAAAYSTDGITWHPSTLPASADWKTITYGGGKFVAVAGYTADEVAYSTDGVDWNTTGIFQNGCDVSAGVAKNLYTYGTEDLEAGVSKLKTGTLYFVYE